MKKPTPLALLTFVPVVLLAWFKPEWLAQKTLLAAALADLVFFRDVSIQLRDLARERSVPYRVRYPFFPFLAGFVGYGAISFGYVPTSAMPIVAIAAASAIAASKFWISTGPLWPYAVSTARA